MRPISWRALHGPVLTAFVSVVAWYVHYHVVHTNVPGVAPFFALLYTAYVGGLVPGLISAVITIAFSALINSFPGQPFVYNAEGLVRFATMAVMCILSTLLIGTLRSRATRLLERERTSRKRVEQSNDELMRLHAALNRVDYGIVLLDKDLSAQFMNQCYLRMFDLPAEQIKPGIQFADLLRYVRETSLITLPRDEVERYIAQRMTQMHDKIEYRADLRLTSGRVVRAQSTPLPEGGWMLSYTDVTDLVSQADEMAQLAAVDGMTDLYNRRHFQKLGQEACERAQRERKPLCLLMIDIDLFKTINDQFGHATGDDVIRSVASLCRTGMQPDAIAARLGGDEFAMLLPNTLLADAAAFAESLRRRIAAMEVSGMGNVGAATVSIGVAESTTGIRTLGDLMLRADTALYQAKRGNRNAVVCATEHHQDIVAA